MNVLVSPNAFKGNLDARQVAQALTEGLLRANPSLEVVQLPIADGGEGTVDILVEATGGKKIEVETRGQAVSKSQDTQQGPVLAVSNTEFRGVRTK